jgi:hypothetical protein
MTPHEMEQAVYNGVKRALLEAVQLSFLGVAAAWLAYEYRHRVVAHWGWLGMAANTADRRIASRQFPEQGDYKARQTRMAPPHKTRMRGIVKSQKP